MGKARKFSISFGLVNIPVGLYNSVKEEKIDLHNVSPAGNRVRIRWVDEVTGEEVPREAMRKGWQASKDSPLVILEDRELQGIRLKSTKAIEVIGLRSGAIDPIQCKSVFYIAPEKGGEKGYSILYRTLKELGAYALGRVVLSGKEYTVAIGPKGNMLILVVLYYPHEILSPPEVALVETSEKEVELGKQLLDAMGEADTSGLKDRYREALKKLIADKAAGKEVSVSEVRVEETAEADISSMLEKSLGALKKKKLGVAVAVQGDDQPREV